MGVASGKIDHQPAFVLHTTAYKETSLIVEVLTRDYGRLSVVARGARRPRAALRGVLHPFQPLTLGWFGKTALKTLSQADWLGALPQLSGVALLSGLYLNELLLRLLPREDAHPALFADYAQAVRALGGRSAMPLSAVLRRFEWRLLQEAGYAPDVTTCTAGVPIAAGAVYRALPQSGFVLVATADPADPAEVRVSGNSLHALATDDWRDETVWRELRAVNRLLLTAALGPEPLTTPMLLRPCA